MNNTPKDPRLQAELPPIYDAVFIDELDSVSAEIRRRTEAGAEEGLLVWTETQSDGKGQHGAWDSPPGGLYCAVLLQPDFDRAQWPETALVALLALGTSVAELLPPLTGLDYRWPNDVLVNGHKVGGIALHTAPSDGLIIVAYLNIAPPVEGWEYASLIADGAAETTPGEALERYGRYLVDGLQRWHDQGLPAICQSLRARGLAAIDESGNMRNNPDQTLQDFFSDIAE